MWEEKENYSIGGKGSQDRRNEGKDGMGRRTDTL